MQCSRCQHENAPGAKFCGECGGRLEAACPSCRTVNPPANKFCQECGTALGAPVAHEDHAVRACYAALRMQRSVSRYADELRRRQGIDVQIRAGLNSGDVVVRSIGSDLNVDYSAVGQTTHLAARMEQLARPGTVMITDATRRLADRYIEVAGQG